MGAKQQKGLPVVVCVFCRGLMIKCALNLSMRHLTPQGVWVACLAPCYSENEIFPLNYASSSDTWRDPRCVSDADMYFLLPHTHIYLNTNMHARKTIKFATLFCAETTQAPVLCHVMHVANDSVLRVCSPHWWKQLHHCRYALHILNTTRTLAFFFL